jgi:hypothetical protein
MVGVDYFRADRHTAAARKTAGATHAQTQAEMTGSPAWAWPWKPGGGCGGVNRSFQFMWCQRVISCTMMIQLPIHSPPLAHCKSRMFRPPARSGTAGLPDATGHLRHRSPVQSGASNQRKPGATTVLLLVRSSPEARAETTATDTRGPYVPAHQLSMSTGREITECDGRVSSRGATRGRPMRGRRGSVEGAGVPG